MPHQVEDAPNGTDREDAVGAELRRVSSVSRAFDAPPSRRRMAEELDRLDRLDQRNGIGGEACW